VQEKIGMLMTIFTLNLKNHKNQSLAAIAMEGKAHLQEKDLR